MRGVPLAVEEQAPCIDCGCTTRRPPSGLDPLCWDCILARKPDLSRDEPGPPAAPASFWTTNTQARADRLDQIVSDALTAMVADLRSHGVGESEAVGLVAEKAGRFCARHTGSLFGSNEEVERDRELRGCRARLHDLHEYASEQATADNPQQYEWLHVMDLAEVD